MSSTTNRTQVLSVSMALALGLSACGGGGGGEGPTYALSIKSAEVSSSYPTEGSALLTGEGFLPPGSRCSPEPSPFEQPGVPLFDQLGPYTLAWTNTSTGKSGLTRLGWNCGTAPSWATWVPLAPGENHIVVSMSSVPLAPELGSGGPTSGPIEQNADVVVTKQ
jgi:hypothetical protein